MILYHFTAHLHLDAIRREGLSRGDVPTSPYSGITAVWLTSSNQAHGHGLGSPGMVIQIPPQFRHRHGGATELRAIDKQAVRITVKIPASDRRLVKWSKWARKRLTRDWYSALDKTAGGGSDTWYLYLGIIPPDWFEDITILRE